MIETLVTIRVASERTAHACQEIIEQTNPDHVLVIRTEPFVEAVRQCLGAAIALRATWLMTVDGDMLVSPDALARLVALARREAQSVWQIQGQMLCKLGGIRNCGPRLIRGAAAKAALEHLTDAVRPEAELTRALPGFRKVECQTGLHDYLQWYRDYHRKGAAHRLKHPTWRVKAQRWQQSDDPDLIAAWHGWAGVPFDFEEKAPL